MKKLLLLFLFISLSFQSISQIDSLSFIDAIAMGDGEGDDDAIQSIQYDNFGNIYLAGEFSGTIDFDPSISKQIEFSGSTSTNLIYITKFNASKELLWVKVFDSNTSSNQVEDLHIDQNGDLLICGNFAGILDLDPDISGEELVSFSENNSDAFMAKFDQNGSFIWAKNMGGESVDNAIAIATNQTNDIFLVGAFSNTADFDPDAGIFELEATGTFQDPFVSRYNQNGEFVWAFSIEGSSLPGYARDIKVTSTGELIVGGSFNNTVDFNPEAASNILTSNGNLDAFLAKYSENGNYIWAKNFGSNQEDQLYEIDLNENDSIFACGYFQGTADFDPDVGISNISSNGSKDIFIASFNQSGALEWANGFGNTSTDIAYSLDFYNGKIYSTGLFINTVDFDPSAGISNLFGNNRDPFILALTDAGDFSWVEAPSGNDFDEGFCIEHSPSGEIGVGGRFNEELVLNPTDLETTVNAFNNSESGFVSCYEAESGQFIGGFSFQDRQGENDICYDLERDDEGNTYACGVYTGGFDFNPKASEVFIEQDGLSSGWLAKYNENLELQWIRSFQSTSTCLAYDLELDANNNVLVTGSFTGTVAFNPGNAMDSITAANQDVFISKFDSSGNFIWVSQLEGNNTASGYGIDTDSENNVLVTGFFRSTVDFDPGVGVDNKTAAIRDVFVVKLNTNGEYVWSMQFGGTSSDYGYDIICDSTDAVIVTGEFRNTANFNPNGPNMDVSASADDIFLAKYGSDASLVWVKTWGGSSNDSGQQLALDSDQNIYLSGLYRNSFIPDASEPTEILVSEGNDDVFILKTDVNGLIQWSHSFGSISFEQINGLAIADSSIFLVGGFGNLTDFNPGTEELFLDVNGGSDAYLLQLNTDGEFEEAAAWGGISSDYAHGVVIFPEYVSIGGSFQREIDFNPNGESAIYTGYGDEDIFILKLGNDVNPCLGDANADGLINVLDLISVSSNFACFENCAGNGDANFDGVVDILDLVAVSAFFGTDCP